MKSHSSNGMESWTAEFPANHASIVFAWLEDGTPLLEKSWPAAELHSKT